MKNQLFEDLIESIKELPTEVLEEMRVNMNEEQMRKDFEDWFKYISEYSEALSRVKYSQFEKHLMWNAWQASRESLVVELPLQYYSNILEGKIVMDASYVYEALDSQGIKWK